PQSESDRRLAEADQWNAEVVRLFRQGRYPEATANARQALAIRQQVLGARHPDTAQSLNNLALLLKSQGDYAAAKPLYEQALAIDKVALGEKHPGYATDLNNLAALLEAQGDSAAAKPLYEQAVDISRDNLDLAADTQTERQQMAMATMLRSSLSSSKVGTLSAYAASSCWTSLSV
ncbi:MAG: tetratricopeptide repeat-containing protein, partial [Planctomycetaceae bacterium]|nr:tetratricopeptide repeat-containing protein [Planctomycetaceae bacterium]